MKIKAVINPVSGNNETRNITAQLVEELVDRKLLHSHDVFNTLPDGREIVDENFLKDCDVVMVAGGDGTLHHVINSLKKYSADKPVAYFPAGTMNDFATGLELPVTIDEFCDMLANPSFKKIDLGKVGEKYFHYVLCGGAIVSISYETDQNLKNMIGKTAYYLSALTQLPQILAGTEIKVESEEYNGEIDAILFLVSNSPIVGGFQNIIPDAKFDDGKLHVCIIKKGTVIDAIQQLYDIINGSHTNRSDIVCFQTKKVTITQKDGGFLDVDGELGESSPADIEIAPGGLTIVVP